MKFCHLKECIRIQYSTKICNQTRSSWQKFYKTNGSGTFGNRFCTKISEELAAVYTLFPCHRYPHLVWRKDTPKNFTKSTAIPFTFSTILCKWKFPAPQTLVESIEFLVSAEVWTYHRALPRKKHVQINRKVVSTENRNLFWYFKEFFSSAKICTCFQEFKKTY